MTLNYGQWHSSLHDDEPLDQDRDLNAAHCWASIGPDNRLKPDGWSLTILYFDGEDNIEIAGGFADNEAGAKAQVDGWDTAHPDWCPEENGGNA